MRITALTACALLASSGAFAADAIVPYVPEPAPVVADTFSWNGGYVGLNAGYAWGKFKHNVETKRPEGKSPLPGTPESEIDYEILDAATYSSSPSGFIGGVQIGYNWQFDQFVFGLETDFQGGRLKDSVSGGVSPYTFNAETKIDWFGTARVRLGYVPTERLMIYATGGLAYAHVKSYMNYAGYESAVSKTKTGYTVGGGAEYAIDNHWSLKTEYLFTDLGKIDTLNAQRGYTKFSAETKANFHTVRVGLNYKF